MVEHERTGIVDLFTWSLSRIAMWAPAFIVAIILFEVFNRYILGSGTYWVNEMSLWVAGGTYLTAGLYAMQQRSHIRIFILYDIAPRWLRKTFDVIGVICVVIFAAAVIFGGFNEAYDKFMRWERFGTVFDPPIPATIKPLILLTMFVLAVQAISNLIYDWNKAPESHDPADEVELDHRLLGLEEDEAVAEVRRAQVLAEEGKLAEPNELISGNPPIPGKKKHP